MRTSTPSDSAKTIQMIFAGSLLLPLASTYFLALSQGGLWLHLNYALLGLVVAGYFGIGYLARRAQNVDWFLTIAVFNLLLLTPELLLRQAGFRYEMRFQFGYPTPTHFESLVPDEELFWKLAEDRAGANQFAFHGRLVQVPKPSGVYRLMFLGDSVAYQGYPEIVEALLNAHGHTTMRFESLNLAVPGYSSHQGRILADKYGYVLEPDLVLLAYGWNDHWQAYGDIDSRKKRAISRSRTEMLLRRLYQHSRLLQWIQYTVVSSSGSGRRSTAVRVPIGEYRDNLVYIGELFAARNTPVIFITPPTAHHELGVPDYLVREGFAVTRESVMTLHRAYNAIVREVASTHNWLILDVERDFTSIDNLSRIFLKDGIHLTPAGSAVIAKRVTDFSVAEWPSLFR